MKPICSHGLLVKDLTSSIAGFSLVRLVEEILVDLLPLSSEHSDSGAIKRKQWGQATRPSQTLQVRFSEPNPLELEGTLKAILLGVSSVGA